MRRYLIALAVSAAIIGGMFIFESAMAARANEAVAARRDLLLPERLVFLAAMFWSRFWGILSPFIVATSLAVAGLVHFLQFVRAPHNKAGRS